MQRPARAPSQLSESLHKRLSAYALAASAAGVAALALAQSAEARIIYTEADVSFGPKSSYLLDLNHNGKADFTIQDSSATSVSGRLSSLVISGAGRNQVEGVVGKVGHRAFLAADLKRGARVPKGRFSPRAQMAFWCTGFISCFATSSKSGYWFNVTDRYLGLKFTIRGQIHYGWARLTVQFFREEPAFKTALTGYAYETLPNKPIIAGKTKGPDVITVQPATLGHLAAGASAIPAWRAEDAH